MALVVQKYGGTSVGDAERIRSVARRVMGTRTKGDRVVVVVSAMAGETDRLLSLAQQIGNSPDKREQDVLLSTGEQISVALLAMALKSMGQEAQSFLGSQIRLLTDSFFGKARIREIEADRITAALEAGKVPVVAGFQGIDDRGNITTLGRGGSDTTAVAIAAALRADVCEIYTDVDGVYTTDPAVCEKARKLHRISYEEMVEMASLGAKVLQIRSVALAMRYGVPLHVRSSFNHHEGTWVCREDKEMERVLVSGVTYDKGEAKITVTRVPDRPGIAAGLFGALAKEDVLVDMIIQNVSREGYTDVTFTVLKTEAAKALTVAKNVAREIRAGDVLLDTDIAKVSIVGAGMRTHWGVASLMFNALARENINIQMISTSEIKISCVIESKYTELAVRALHDAFELDKGQVREEIPPDGSH
ncbi:MAG: aspartate kinase [Deltaproteobacteria bacterium]|nr:aspartate kinase [Deltaproteobacteria bacterium]MBW2123004.1 aspartate kinase [Deltaproteobacteria bacterium]